MNNLLRDRIMKAAEHLTTKQRSYIWDTVVSTLIDYAYDQDTTEAETLVGRAVAESVDAIRAITGRKTDVIWTDADKESQDHDI